MTNPRLGYQYALARCQDHDQIVSSEINQVDKVLSITCIIQGVPWQLASGIGLLQACFRTSEVPKGVIVTPRVGANYI